MDEAEYCDRVSIMVDGRIAALGTPAELKQEFGASSDRGGLRAPRPPRGRRMSALLGFMRKEVHHILRDRRTLMILLMLPLAQVLLFGFAVRTDIDSIRSRWSIPCRTPSHCPCSHGSRERACSIW
jgi:hypothetical protein